MTDYYIRIYNKDEFFNLGQDEALFFKVTANGDGVFATRENAYNNLLAEFQQFNQDFSGAVQSEVNNYLDAYDVPNSTNARNIVGSNPSNSFSYTDIANKFTTYDNFITSTNTALGQKANKGTFTDTVSNLQSNLQGQIDNINDTLTNLNNSVADTNWVDVTMDPDFKKYDDLNANKLRIRKVGKLVEIRGVVQPTNANIDYGSVDEYKLVGFFADDYKPSRNVIVPQQTSGTYTCMLSVTANADIMVGRFSKYTSYPYKLPKNQWIPIHVMYFVD